MPVSLSLYDQLFIAFYFILVVIVGVLSARKQTTEGFLLADRKLGVLSLVATTTASSVGALMLVTYMAFVYTFGISAIWYFIGSAAGFMLFYLFAVKLKREADTYKYYTLSNYFLRRYGKTSSNLTLIITLVIYVLGFGIALVGASKILVALTGLSYLPSLFLVGGAIMIYLTTAGFKGVVSTDVIQFISIIVLFFVIAVFLGKNFAYHPEQWQIAGVGMQNIIGFFLAGLLVPFAYAEYWQRIYASKDTKTIKKSVLFTVFSFLLIGFILSVIGIIIKIKLPGINPDMALVEGFRNLLPTGLMGLAIIALFAAVMSSADTGFYTASSSFVQDFWARRKKIDPKNVVKTMRRVLVGAVLIGILLSYLIPSLVKITLILVAFMIPLSITVIVTWLFQNLDKFIVNFTLLTGSIITFIASLYFALKNELNPIIVIISIVATILSLVVSKLLLKYVRR